VVEMHRAMREMMEEVERRMMGVWADVEAMKMSIHIRDAMIAMERIVAVMDREPGVIPEDMR
jgi:hypothetical protein